jgi:tetratricopeptide (TPR) repeat protein
MKYFSRLFLLFFILFTVQSWSQENLKLDSLLKVYKSQPDDSLKTKTLGNLYNMVLYNDPEAALRYAKEEIILSQKLKYRSGEAMGLYHLGVYFNNNNNIDSAKYYYDKSVVEFEQLGDLKGQVQVNHGLAILEYSKGNYDASLDILEKNIEIYTQKLNDSSGLAISYDLKGFINNFKGNHTIALQETLKALKIFERINDPIRKADALNHLAATEFHLGNYLQSIQYNKEGLKIYTENNDKHYQAQALNDIGNVYLYMKKYKQAIEYLDKSIALSNEMKIPELKATSLANLGKTYVDLNKFDKAILNLNQSLKIVEGTESKNKIVESLNDLGMAYSRMNSPLKAIPYFNRAIILADSIKAKENLRIGYYNRAMAYAQLNRFDKAFKDHQNYKAVSDSIYDTTKSRQIEELRTIYETEKKEQQIVLQEQEINLLEQKAEINGLQRALMGIGLLLSLIGLYALRQKMKRNKLQREKIAAELAFKKKELTTHALHLAKKNEVLENVKQKAKELKLSESPLGYQQLIQTINFDQQDDKNWESFIKYFEQVHKNFASNVKSKYPEVSKNELRFMALIKMNMSSKEIATILNISNDGVKKARQRLRKKLALSPQDSLENTVLAI